MHLWHCRLRHCRTLTQCIPHVINRAGNLLHVHIVIPVQSDTDEATFEPLLNCHPPFTSWRLFLPYLLPIQAPHDPA